MEEKRESAFKILKVLQEETEEYLTEKKIALRSKERHIRELNLTIEAIRKKKDPHIDLFSPIGVHSLSNSEFELTEELKVQEKEYLEQKELVQELEERKQGIEILKQCITEQIENEAELLKKKEESCQIHLLESQEIDRNRIARDLHDSTVQNLTMLVHKTELCTKLLNVDNVRVMLELQTMIESMKMTIDDIREIIYDLRPMSLNNLGIGATLESYAAYMKRHHNIETEVIVNGKEPNILQIEKITLYRIAQEACNNIVKHARASKISINLTFKKKEIILVIQDNGIGFDVEKIKRMEKDELYGLGLYTMKERTKLMNGKVDIKSVLQQGTTISITVPLKIEKGEF